MVVSVHYKYHYLLLLDVRRRGLEKWLGSDVCQHQEVSHGGADC